MFLRRLGPLLSSIKESTGIVGLEVVPNAKQVLIGLYQQTLSAVQVGSLSLARVVTSKTASQQGAQGRALQRDRGMNQNSFQTHHPAWALLLLGNGPGPVGLTLTTGPQSLPSLWGPAEARPFEVLQGRRGSGGLSLLKKVLPACGCRRLVVALAFAPL